MFMFRDLFPVVFDDDDGAGGGAPPVEAPEGQESEGREAEPEGREEFDLDRAKAKIAKANKEAEGLRRRLKEYEDASKSDQEKLNERLQAAEERASYADKLDVALDKAPEGMSVAQVRKLAKRLHGSTKEELEADAEELFADFKTEGGGQEPRRRPTERLRPGAAPSSEPEETDPIKLAAKVPRMY